MAKPDLTLLSRKPFLTLEELTNLLFYRKVSLGRRGGIKHLSNDLNRWVIEELDGEELTCFKRGYNDFNGHYVEFKKGVICAWLLKKDVLGWLKEKGIEVPIEVVEFIEKSATIKKKTKLPAKPDTDKAKEKHLREAYVSKVEKKITKNEKLRNTDLLKDQDLKFLIKDSGLPKKYPAKSTLERKWIPEARKNVNIPAPKGRPPKK
jgi:hypothetical protein